MSNTPLLQNLELEPENKILRDSVQDSKRIIDKAYTVVMDQSLYFKWSQSITELILTTLYELLYTAPETLPYARETGIGIDGFLWETNIEEVAQEITQKLNEALNDNKFLLVRSISLQKVDEHTLHMYVTLEYDSEIIPLTVPIRIRPAEENI